MPFELAGLQLSECQSSTWVPLERILSYRTSHWQGGCWSLVTHFWTDYVDGNTNPPPPLQLSSSDASSMPDTENLCLSLCLSELACRCQILKIYIYLYVSLNLSVDTGQQGRGIESGQILFYFSTANKYKCVN